VSGGWGGAGRYGAAAVVVEQRSSWITRRRRIFAELLTHHHHPENPPSSRATLARAPLDVDAMPRAREKAMGDASISLMDSVHDEVLALILAAVPAPDRLRCEEVCTRWRRILTTHDEFTRALIVPFDPQDDSPTVRTADGWSEIREDARDDALLAAVAKAGGRLRHLSLVGCASVTPDAVLAALRSNPEITRLSMHEGESEEYLLRLRPRDLDALAGAMHERATDGTTPRLEVSVEVAGNRELDALTRLLANAAESTSAPPPAPIVIHGVEVHIVALTLSLLFPDAVLVPHLGDDATDDDDDDAVARETNAATAKLLADAFRAVGPRGLTRVNFGDRSLTDPRWASATLRAMAVSCASLRELRVDGYAFRAESTCFAFHYALESTSSTLRRLSVRRAWCVAKHFAIPVNSVETVHLEMPTIYTLVSSAAASGARAISFAKAPDGGGRVSRSASAAGRPVWDALHSHDLRSGLDTVGAPGRSLTHLDVGFVEPKLDDLIEVVEGAGLARLAYLGVAGPVRDSEGEAAATIKEGANRLVAAVQAHAETLQYLEAGGLPQPVIAGLVRSVPKFDALHTLDLSGSPPRRKKDNDASFAALGEVLGDAACKLRRLVLVHCGVVAANLREIGKGAVRSKTLVAVDLSFNSNLGDDGGCKELARWIRKADRLSRLELEACGVGDAGAKILASAVAERSTFRRLDLAANLGIRKAGRAALAEASKGRPGIWCKETADDAPWSKGYGTDDDEAEDDDGDGGYFSEDDGFFAEHSGGVRAGSRWGQLTT
jgi:hypothetical protein